ncbi:hypothetical protein PVK06_025970 [Gossypium arboreum]|uniref:Uncharacterized protein n=1 Tax=Gossypium arboreum TaxID=29729 RepID=A0ABR0NZ53_GOSAR|nr:hypothetical protein PVK06_025970 [Gossypium arboreum]
MKELPVETAENEDLLKQIINTRQCHREWTLLEMQLKFKVVWISGDQARLLSRRIHEGFPETTSILDIVFVILVKAIQTEKGRLTQLSSCSRDLNYSHFCLWKSTENTPTAAAAYNTGYLNKALHHSILKKRPDEAMSKNHLKKTNGNSNHSKQAPKIRHR